jgi:hypothetical protein
VRVKSVNDLPIAVRPDVQAELDKLSGACPAPKSKYRNKRVEIDGITFDSKWESQRYGELRNLERLGVIQMLRVHEAFGLHVMSKGGSPVRIAAYVADFMYVRNRETVIEDAKSAPTRRKEAYVLKRKHFEAEYGLPIVEVERSRPRLGVNL